MSYGRGPPEIDGMTSLKVDNLTYRTTPDDLRRCFEKYGDVGDIYIPRDRFSRESRGFAFIRYYDKRDAEDAMDSLDGYVLDGRELRVQMARYGRPSGGDAYRSSRGQQGRGSSRYGRSRRRSRSRSSSRSRSRRHRSRSNSRSRSRSRSRSKERRSKDRRSRSRSGSRAKDGEERKGSKSSSRSPTKRSPTPGGAENHEETRKSKSRSVTPD